MAEDKILHSVCKWTFHAGKGGFVPADIRPEWDAQNFGTTDFIRLVKERIVPRLPEYIELGVELHYDNEYNENNAEDIADTLVDSSLYLAMITPGAHLHFAYGGIASLDSQERKAAERYGERSVELAYDPLRKAWHPDLDKAPALVIWNGSFGYDIATVYIKQMYQNLKESVAKLCRFEQSLGGDLYFALEPKPNEGHPALLIPTVASALLFWRRLEEEFGISRAKKGLNKEIGHSEMIGLDHIHDTVEELDGEAMLHTHLNSQGYNDGIILGGPAKYDIDHGVRINGMNIAIAGLMQQAGYRRWKGHDMQVRPYDNVEQGIDRVVRSILSWEACDKAAGELDVDQLQSHLANRDTAKAEDMMREAVVRAYKFFHEMVD
ncbi:xylose isomerase [candidate division KSB1 bacterium]|nr:xylose isomerase [candidate division KSB1 bacterium]NIV70793.1 xylose isomerase [Phycisphaerae bacterium]NIR72911.1 xylose isomerase [candidate division KSB1 bacterium]NIT73709.1 xylose isomerase [candidate division KSB1 bacterium]NIU27581.1 xylose isomerase [candidate division KSB1 bacterium]